MNIKNILIFIIILFLISCSNNNDIINNKNSAHSKIRPNIVNKLKHQITDYKSPISYCEFEQLKKDSIIDNNQYEDLIKYAYKNYNPIIFKKADKQVDNKSYSLNFLWLNANKLEEKNHILGDNNINLEKHIINPLIDWQNKQPLATINFWYDGLIVDSNILENTKNIFKSKNLNKIIFRDIRSLDLVKNNSILFDLKTDLYFRVDLTKAIILDHVIKNDDLEYAAAIDTDVAAIVGEQLFDQKTLEQLNLIGYIFGTALTEEENSFVMLYKKAKLDDIKMHYDIVIKKSIEIALDLLNKNMKIQPQIVFHKYTEFRIAMKKEYQKLTNKKFADFEEEWGVGKPLIFPPSQFGGGGYSSEEIKALKEASLGPNGC
jgi:hypothetical protein